MISLRASLLSVVLGTACAGATTSGPMYETREERQARAAGRHAPEKYQAAEAAFQKGDWPSAEAGFRDLAEKDPSAAAPRLRLATILQKQHRYAEAEQFLREVLLLDPERLATRYALVSVLLHQRRVDDATQEFQVAQNYGPGDENMELRLKGAMALRSGRAEQATRFFEDLLKSDPKDTSGHVGMGVVKASQGDFDVALGFLQMAVVLNPNLAVAHYDLALAYYHGGKLERAIEEGRTAVAQDPYFMPARNNLAATLVQLGQMAEAKAVLDEAIRLRPSYAPAHNNLAIVHISASDLASAESELAAAIELSPRIPAFHFNLGIVHFRRGQTDAAVGDFTRVVELDKASADALRNLRWLEGLKAGTIHGTELPAAASHYAVDEYDE
jgi:tetratricopeptide (TPR) repeat protein